MVREICKKLHQIKKWWKKFVKDHIIDEVDKNDPNF
jgi:hypothetical protein